MEIYQEVCGWLLYLTFCLPLGRIMWIIGSKIKDKEF